MSCNTPLSNFLPKGVPAKFQTYLKHISWVISGTSSSKLSCNPRHPSRNISCNHRHHMIQPSWRRICSTHRITRNLGSTATSTVITSLLPLTDYISGAENETLWALSGHTNGNIEMRSPSAAVTMTMVAAVTIVRFPPVPLSRVTVYIAGHLHTAVPHCSHSRAPIVHTAVPRENNEHGCVYLRRRAVCKLPGCVEGHPWLLVRKFTWYAWPVILWIHPAKEARFTCCT